MPTAILVDGDFFIRRLRIIRNKEESPENTADILHKICLDHLVQKDGQRTLYRIFFYDCPPLEKKLHNPVSLKPIDLKKTPTARFRSSFHNELRKKRKVALRLGYLSDGNAHWKIKPEKTKELLKHVSSGDCQIQNDDISESDVIYDVRKKGVDMRIGLDIASMAYKKQVDQIILIAGDSDFIPAAKLARREGIDFILDPMWQNINDDLYEHIDGLRSVLPKPEKK